jgi:hypothetical protein
MKFTQRHLYAYLFGVATLAGTTAPAWAQVSLGSAADFAVLGSTLGGTNVTCTDGVVTGDIGVSPRIGAVVPFTNTRCLIAGGTPPATNANADAARANFLSAYATAVGILCNTGNTLSGNLADKNLAPGNYCLSAEAKTGTLTLTGGADAVWIFRVSGALTGNSFSVVMNGGQPCNVFWAPVDGAVTMTDSNLKGTILAGDVALGAITLTRGTMIGRALANLAVTITGTSVIDCDTVSGVPNCKPMKHHRHHKGQGNGNDGDDDNNEHDEDDGSGSGHHNSYKKGASK